jgi:hypothetical protein
MNQKMRRDEEILSEVFGRDNSFSLRIILEVLLDIRAILLK